jgi:cytoskeletal protein CcmA (bactofilin family)
MKKKNQAKGFTKFAKEGAEMNGEGKMNSIIGNGCKIKGTIEVKEGTLRVDGEFEGTINCPGTLVVGKDGKVMADVNVSSAVIGGKVTGNIDAREKIELQAGSRLEGDIKTTRLVIDEGVFFEGSCKMSPDNKAGASTPAPGKEEAQKEKKSSSNAWAK